MRFNVTFTFEKPTTWLLQMLGLSMVLIKYLAVDLLYYFINALGIEVYLEGSRTSDFILNFNGVDWYLNDKLMDNENPSEYTWVKEIEEFSKKVRIKLG